MGLESWQWLQFALKKNDFKPSCYGLDLIRIAVNEKVENEWKELRKSKRVKPRTKTFRKYRI